MTWTTISGARRLETYVGHPLSLRPPYKISTVCFHTCNSCACSTQPCGLCILKSGVVWYVVKTGYHTTQLFRMHNPHGYTGAPIVSWRYGIRLTWQSVSSLGATAPMTVMPAILKPYIFFSNVLPAPALIPEGFVCLQICRHHHHGWSSPMQHTLLACTKWTTNKVLGLLQAKLLNLVLSCVMKHATTKDISKQLRMLQTP